MNPVVAASKRHVVDHLTGARLPVQARSHAPKEPSAWEMVKRSTKEAKPWQK